MVLIKQKIHAGSRLAQGSMAILYCPSLVPQNQKSLLVIRQIDNYSPRAVTEGKTSPFPSRHTHIPDRSLGFLTN